MDKILEQMSADMKRLQGYFPYRIVWGAIDPNTLQYVTGANATMRQVNDYARKGYTCYTCYTI